MDTIELMASRHSVRQYTDKKITEDIRKEIENCIKGCNEVGGLHMQAFFEEGACFETILAHYGKFRGVKNYIALVGEKAEQLEERVGYYGEQVVLKLQELGLNSCWVLATYGKGKCKADIKEGEKLVCVIAFGYGATQGVPHKSKELSALSKAGADAPDWYQRGMDAVLLAPTAMNQQKFVFSCEKDRVTAAIAGAGRGSAVKIDLGIVKYQFEAASGHKVQ